MPFDKLDAGEAHASSSAGRKARGCGCTSSCSPTSPASTCAPTTRPVPWQERLPPAALRAARFRARGSAAAAHRRSPSTATACCRNITPCRSASCSSTSTGSTAPRSAAPATNSKSCSCWTAANRSLAAGFGPDHLALVLHAGDQSVLPPQRPHQPLGPRGGAPDRAGPHAAAGFRGFLGAVGGGLRRRRQRAAAVPAVLRSQRSQPQSRAPQLLSCCAASRAAVIRALAPARPALELSRPRSVRSRWSIRTMRRCSARSAPARPRSAVHQPRPAAVDAGRQAAHRFHHRGERAGRLRSAASSGPTRAAPLPRRRRLCLALHFASRAELPQR